MRLDVSLYCLLERECVCPRESVCGVRERERVKEIEKERERETEKWSPEECDCFFNKKYPFGFGLLTFQPSEEKKEKTFQLFRLNPRNKFIE